MVPIDLILELLHVHVFHNRKTEMTSVSCDCIELALITHCTMIVVYCCDLMLKLFFFLVWTTVAYCILGFNSYMY